MLLPTDSETQLPVRPNQPAAVFGMEAGWVLNGERLGQYSETAPVFGSGHSSREIELVPPPRANTCTVLNQKIGLCTRFPHEQFREAQVPVWINAEQPIAKGQRAGGRTARESPIRVRRTAAVNPIPGPDSPGSVPASAVRRGAVGHADRPNVQQLVRRVGEANCRSTASGERGASIPAAASDRSVRVPSDTSCLPFQGECPTGSKGCQRCSVYTKDVGLQ